MAMGDYNPMHLHPGPAYPDRPMAHLPGDSYNQHPVMMLTVTEIERLAKAGVKLDWADLKGLITPDPVEPAPIFNSSQLTRPLVERWQRNTNARTNELRGDREPFPFFLSAYEQGGTMYVFVANGSSSPVILEDDAKMYPSDALIAKLHLLTELHKK